MSRSGLLAPIPWCRVKPEQFVEAINGLGFKAGTPVKG